MDEQEVKVILPSEADYEKTESIFPPPRKTNNVFSVIMQIVPMVFAGIAILFFSCTAVILTSAVGLKSSDVGRMIVGEFVGGMKNVTYISGHDSLSSLLLQTNNGQSTDEHIPSSESISSASAEYSDYVIGLNNETPYTPDMSEIVNQPRAIPALDELQSEYGCDSPLVLILHTHGSEGYADSADSSYRTSDTERNVVAIGKIIADLLNSAGIPAIHCETLFDAEDFNLAYYNSSLEIRSTIAEFPSISYIIDVHRDSVTLENGNHIPLKCTVNGQVAAQLMFVIGTDHGGSGHVGWQDNLALAARLQHSIHNSSRTMMRNINLRSASFNEQYTRGSLLLEVGSSGNTIEEAKISAGIFADALIREIKGY